MKRRKDDDEGSGYSWMDTYGDMVTLLLCFFVLLFSFSSIDAEKWQQLVGALTGTSFNTEVSTFDVSSIRKEAIDDIDTMVDYDSRQDEPAAADDEDGSGEVSDTGQDDEPSGAEEDGGGDTNVVQSPVDGAFDELYENIKTYVLDNGMENKINVSRTDATIIIRFSEMALFNSGKADITPESTVVLESVTQIISRYLSAIKMVRIEGHTDDVPMTSGEFSDNWDLSINRAINTLRLMLETGLISDSKLSATGYGEYQPIATNDTDEGRAKNRRVDIVLEKYDE